MNHLKTTGVVSIAMVPDGTFQPGEAPSFAEMTKVPGAELREYHNLETTFVLEAIAKSMIAGVGQIDGSTVSIAPTSMAVGIGTIGVTPSDTSISGESLRKHFTDAGCSKSRGGAVCTFTITLQTGEANGPIGALGLFCADSGSGSVATGSLTVGGAPAAGDAITVVVGGRAVAPYFVVLGSTTTSAVAAGLAAALNNDSYFNSFYTAVSVGSVVTITSTGKGTAYNQSVTVSVTPGGTTSVTPVSPTGGATPGGTLLAAANASFVKLAGKQVVIEWKITVSN